MREALSYAVRQFRMGMIAGGSEALRGFLDALHADLTAGPTERAIPLLPWFREILEAQERGDYLRVADLLEYEVLPRLG